MTDLRSERFVERLGALQSPEELQKTRQYLKSGQVARFGLDYSEHLCYIPPALLQHNLR